MSDHAKLSPSAAHRWMHCPGSIRLSEGIEVPPSVYADEGSAAHHLAYVCLTSGADAQTLAGRVIRKVNSGWSILQKGAKAAEGDYEITDEMAEAVQIYIDAVRADRIHGARMNFEHRVTIPGVGIWGTADCFRYVPDKKVTVYDYKHGAGVAVDVEGNPQLMIYALGALDGKSADTVELVIVQPRARHKDGPVRRWEIPAADLLAWKADVLAPAVHATQQPDAPLCAGEWCKFCPALPVCPAVKAHAIEVATADFQVVELPPPEQLQKSDIVRVMQSSELLKKWLVSVESYAQSLMEKGESFPGFKLVRKRTNRKWIDEAAAAATLAGQPVFETALMSPSKVEKLKLGVDLSALIERPEGALTIAPESDRRDAVLVNTASDFVELEDFLS